jgi:hypothetical protein
LDEGAGAILPPACRDRFGSAATSSNLHPFLAVATWPALSGYQPAGRCTKYRAPQGGPHVGHSKPDLDLNGYQLAGRCTYGRSSRRICEDLVPCSVPARRPCRVATTESEWTLVHGGPRPKGANVGAKPLHTPPGPAGRDRSIVSLKANDDLSRTCGAARRRPALVSWPAGAR